MIRKTFILLMFVFAFVLISCTKPNTLPEYIDLTEKTNFTVLDFPQTKFDNVIWWTDGSIMALQSEPTRPLRQPYAFDGDRNLRFLDLEQDIINCSEITSYDYPTQLPDGRLGWKKRCVTDNAFTSESYLVAYDLRTGQLEQIVQKPLKSYNISECYSWNPDMTIGIQKVSGGLTGTLNWLTPDGPEPVKITLQDGNRIWDLSKDYEENGSIEGGRMTCPAWSPNGEQIAVFVSFDAMGVDSISRLDEQTQLMLISPETGESESVLSGIYYPEFIAWSPDGKKIAFVGDLTNELWVFEVETRLLFLIDNGAEFDDISWSPDSQQLAVLWCDDRDCEITEIRKYELSFP